MGNENQGHQLEESLLQPSRVEEMLQEPHRRRAWRDGGIRETLEGGINRLSCLWREEHTSVPRLLALTMSNLTL